MYVTAILKRLIKQKQTLNPIIWTIQEYLEVHVGTAFL
jgi:hypothetical protein